MNIDEARSALKRMFDVRRSIWPVGRFVTLVGERMMVVVVDKFGHRRTLREEASLSWGDLEANDWHVATPAASVASICEHPVWDTVRPFFGERPHELRGLEVGKLPRDLSLRLQQLELPCCACGKTIRVFRQRHGSDWSRLYFSPACRSADSPGCSRGIECRDEMDRIRSYLAGHPIDKPQLGLF